MQRTAQISDTRRGGFTLLEMLIVISIIVALVAIATAVYGTILETAREAATRTTIAKAEALLQDQITAWRREFEDSNVIELEAQKAAYSSFTPQQKLLAALKAYYGTHFPQRGGEPIGSAYTGWVATGDEFDSSELLYLTLTKGKVRGAASADSDSFNGSELADTDEDGFQEIIDGWGRPLRFYRWPTRLLNPFGLIATVTTDPITINGPATLPVDSTTDFQAVYDEIRDTSKGGLANANIYVVIGREIIEVDGSLGVVTRGALNTDPEPHAAGSVVKLAPFPQIVTLLLGSISTSAAIHDPDDSRGVLLSSAPATFETNYHTLDSFHTPLIISAGSDGDLGLLEPATVASGDWNWGNLAQPDTQNGSDFSTIVNPGSTALSDNITNLSGGN